MFITALRSSSVRFVGRQLFLLLSLFALAGHALAAGPVDQHCDEADGLPLGGTFDRQLSDSDRLDVMRLDVPTSGMLAVEVSELDQHALRPRIAMLGPNCGRSGATAFDTRWIAAVQGPGHYYLAVSASGLSRTVPYRLQVSFLAEDEGVVGDRLAFSLDADRGALYPFSNVTEPIDEVEDDESPLAPVVGGGLFGNVTEPVDEVEDDESPLAPVVGGGLFGNVTEPVDEVEDDESPLAPVVGGGLFGNVTEPVDEVEDDESPLAPVVGGGLFGNVTEPVDEVEDDETPLAPVVGGGLFGNVTEPVDEVEDDETPLAPVVGGGLFGNVTEPIDEIEDDEVIIQIEEDGVLTLNATGTDLIAYLSARDRAAGSVLATGRLTDGGRSLMVPVRAGRYGLRATAGHDDVGTALIEARLYSFCAMDAADDHAESSLCATKIRLGDRMHGVIRGSDAIDRDIFAFTLEAPATVVLETEGDLDTFGVLLDADGMRLAADDDSGSFGNFRIQRTLSAGYYQLRVEGTAAAEGAYLLRTGASVR